MPRHNRMAVLNALHETGLVPVFYQPDVEVAQKIVKAVVAGGARCVEMTNRGDQAHLVFTELYKFCKAECPEVCLGIGSIVDAGTATIYMQCGADFIVGPTLNAEVAVACNRRKIPYAPGCGSASEIQRAYELGVEVVKVFPAGQVGGPAFAKAVMAPCPWVSVMPTGGVDSTEESVKDWIGAGCVCLGMGSKLVTKDDVASGNWNAITERTRQVLAWVREAKAAR